VNRTGDTYVAYLFAHDPLGPSGDGSDGLIACGSYTGTGAAGLEIDLGWEPQWFLMKRADTSGADWFIFDNMRGFTASSNPDRVLRANTSDSEGDAGPAFRPTATGVEVQGTFSSINASGGTYIYIAIRRGPMREPTSGTEVFATGLYTGNGTNNRILSNSITADSVFTFYRGAGFGKYVYDRLRGNEYWLNAAATSAESRILGGSTGRGYNLTKHQTDLQLGSDDANWFNINGDPYGFWSFRRAPGFFDGVAYTGNGTAGRTVSHNLGVAPELIVHKCRNSSSFNWYVYSANLGVDYRLVLDATSAAQSGYATLAWNNTSPTADEITLGSWGNLNGSGDTYIAYLFATLPGVSKVGSYTGNGSSQTINCNFTGGARFVLIKRTDSTGDWYVWDTARGIVTGNDPHLSLNTTAAQVTSDDTIDPDSSGFIVNQVAATNVNVSSASYIFFAVS